MSVFYPTRNFRQFWADPTFSAVRSIFLAEEEAKNVEILPHPKFWPFPGRPHKDVRFYPTLNCGHFGAPSLVTLLTIPNVIDLKHPTPNRRDRLWPIPFWPIHFWPSWFWPKPILAKANFWPIQFFGKYFWCHGGAPKGVVPNPEKMEPEVMGPQ